jgi:hypothetical protein
MSHSPGSGQDARRPSRQETSPEGGPPRISFPSESGAGGSSPQFTRGGESYNSRDSHHHPDPQVAQDIDAARQMSRARATSIDQRGESAGAGADGQAEARLRLGHVRIQILMQQPNLDPPM